MGFCLKELYLSILKLNTAKGQCMALVLFPNVLLNRLPEWHFKYCGVLTSKVNSIWVNSDNSQLSRSNLDPALGSFDVCFLRGYSSCSALS